MSKKKSFFSRLGNALREPEEMSAEDIDMAVKNSVDQIKSSDLEMLEAESVFSTGGLGEADEGDTVFILDLIPIFKIIGGTTGRAADGVRETCTRIFTQRVPRSEGAAALEAGRFCMRFNTGTPAQGFHRAANIINEIGKMVLSDRFDTMEVPDILIAAEFGDIANEDGSINIEKLTSTVKSGGRIVAFDKPEPNAPQWMRLSYEKKAEAIRMVTIEKQSASKANPQWETVGSSNTRGKGGNWVVRSGKDRRIQTTKISCEDKRKIFDRRGRGY